LYQTLSSSTLLHIDKHEEVFKIIPVSKVEKKFTEMITDKILLITCKKIIELSSDNIMNAKINIISFSKMKKIEENSNKDLVNIYLENDILYSYKSIYSVHLLKSIFYLYSKECLLDLEVIRD